MNRIGKNTWSDGINTVRIDIVNEYAHADLCVELMSTRADFGVRVECEGGESHSA